MTVQSFEPANLAILDIFTASAADLSTFQAERLRSILGSVIAPEKVAHFTEFAFANADDLAAGSRAAAADVAAFAAANGFYGLAEAQRGFKIAAILRGETVEDAPLPDPRWVEPASTADEG